MKTRNTSLSVLAVAALATVLLAAVTAGPALAAKGGNGKGHGQGETSGTSVTLAVSPDPVPAWGTVYTVTGTGFTPGNAVNFVLDGVATYARADENGSASTVYTSWTPGSYTVFAKEWIGKGYVEVGSVTFDVVEQ